MKSCYFALTYVGGSVDLLAFREHIAAHYPDAALVNARRQTVLYVPVAEGEVSRSAEAPDSDPTAYEIAIYQFDSGYGLVMVSFRSRGLLQALSDHPSRYVFGHPALAGALLDYARHALGVADFSGTDALVRTRADQQKLRARTGIKPLVVGTDGLDVNIIGRETLLLVGTDAAELDLSAAEDISTGQSGRLFTLARQRYWAPGLDEELTWEVIYIALRELLPARMTNTAVRWLGVIEEQLGQMTMTLAERNEVAWAQERDDVEQLDVNYHRFAVSSRALLAVNDQLDLRLIDADRWALQSDFNRQRLVFSEALAEAHGAIERMARPLDFREFQTLKTGVEEVENRIMLLTVLLVVIELTTRILEPGEWSHKGLLGVVLLSILLGYFLFERWRGSVLLRRGRRLLTRSRVERTRSEIRDYEREIQRMKSEDFLSAETRGTFIRDAEASVQRLRVRLAEYEAELDSAPKDE